jgi:hypothetical protein
MRGCILNCTIRWLLHEEFLNITSYWYSKLRIFFMPCIPYLVMNKNLLPVQSTNGFFIAVQCMLARTNCARRLISMLTNWLSCQQQKSAGDVSAFSVYTYASCILRVLQTMFFTIVKCRIGIMSCIQHVRNVR